MFRLMRFIHGHIVLAVYHMDTRAALPQENTSDHAQNGLSMDCHKPVIVGSRQIRPIDQKCLGDLSGQSRRRHATGSSRSPP